MFDDYRYISPVDDETPAAHISPGYDAEGAVMFGVNLATILSCLNMFGTANVGNYGNDQSANYGGGPSANSAGQVTAVKLSYNGIGSKFTMM